MNKSGLIYEVTLSTGMPQDAATRSVNAALNAIIYALKSGDSVNIPGFGTFTTKVRPSRTGRNPLTGEAMVIPEKTIPVFKPGKNLKEAAEAKR